MMEKVKAQEQLAKRLKVVFEQGDASGNGLLSREEFEDMIEDPNIVDLFQAMELEVYEISALFNLLCEVEEEVNFEDFLGGALRLKGNARSIDAVVIMHEQRQLKRFLVHIGQGVELLSGQQGHSNWTFARHNSKNKDHGLIRVPQRVA